MKRSQKIASEIGYGATLWRHADTGIVVAVNDDVGDSWVAVFYRGAKRIGKLDGLRPPRMRCASNADASDDLLVAQAAIAFGSNGPIDPVDERYHDVTDDERTAVNEWCAIQEAFGGYFSADDDESTALKAVRE